MAGTGGAAAGTGGAAAFVVTTPAFMTQAGCGHGAMASNCGIFPRDNTSAHGGP